MVVVLSRVGGGPRCDMIQGWGVAKDEEARFRNSKFSRIRRIYFIVRYLLDWSRFICFEALKMRPSEESSERRDSSRSDSNFALRNQTKVALSLSSFDKVKSVKGIVDSAVTSVYVEQVNKESIEAQNQ